MPANPSAAHVGSTTQHVGCALAGVGAPSVLINGKPAWTSAMSVNCPVHGVECFDMGSESVLIGGNRMARANTGGGVAGDFLLGAGPPNQIMTGSPNVLVGSPPLGLATEENLAHFCKLQCALKRDWPSLSPAERRRRYEQLVGDMAHRIDVPAFGVRDKDTAGGLASFSRNKWAVNVPKGTFEKNHPPDGRVTIHELRHGEQAFQALQARGGGSVFDAPRHVRLYAEHKPLEPDSPEGRQAELHAQNQMDDAGLENWRDIIREVGDAHEQAGVSSKRYYEAGEAYYNQPGGAGARPLEEPGNCNGCT